MSQQRNLTLRLLNETTASEDLFEDKTHSRIADTLFTIIQGETSEGLTIGVEGSWGSGKSTVISILEKKLKQNPEIFYFYFDAWVHEGDPLRRVFLETMLEQIDGNDPDINLLKGEISNRTKKSETTTNQTVTTLGKKLALTALVVPLGAAIISDTASNVTLASTANFYWLFALGVLLSLAPISILLHYCYMLKKQNKNIMDFNNWVFMEGESQTTTIQETSEDEERSSIEFERYFEKILKYLFNKSPKLKIVMVADNLDRVDPASSLKIWSTLQTFLQRKDSGNGRSHYKNIWVLVPYDEEGLAKLWETNQAEDDLKQKDCAKSFFDKCFQVRIEVPKLLLSGWQSFCEDCINKSLIGLTENDKIEILNILKWTRESVNDIPTPREIKNYVNQVGLLLLHCHDSISTQAIAYFSIQKYMKFRTNKDIETDLVNGKLPLESHAASLSANIKTELCGILFGVSPDKGEQLLLEPAIENALSNMNIEKANLLANSHSNAFWTVFHLHQAKIPSTLLSKYSLTVYKGLLDKYPSQCSDFINHLKAKIDALTSIDFPKDDEIEECISLLKLLEYGNHNVAKIWNLLIRSLKDKLSKDGFDFSKGTVSLKKLASCLSNRPKKTEVTGISIDNWINWARATFETESTTHDLLVPKESFSSELAAKVTVGSLIPDGVSDFVEYLVYSGKKEWKVLINKIKDHINHNNGTQQNDVYSNDVLNILLSISFVNEPSRDLIKQIILSGQFFNLIHNNPTSVNIASLLIAKIIPTEMHNIQIPAIANSANGVNLCQAFWKSSETDKARYVWEQLDNYEDYKTVWVLAEDPNNKLIGSIIEAALNDESLSLFKQPSQLSNLKTSISLLNDKLHPKLTKLFIEHTDIESEILSKSSIDLQDNARTLDNICEHTSNNELLTHLQLLLKSVSVDVWNETFTNDTYLSSLALSVKDKCNEFKLSNNYYESFTVFMQKWISTDIAPEDWQKENIDYLFDLLPDSFIIQLKKDLAKYIVQYDCKINAETMSCLLLHTDVNYVISKGKQQIQDNFIEALRLKDHNMIKTLYILLCQNESVNFVADSHLSETLSEPVQSLLQDQIDNDLIDMVQKLAIKFKVVLLTPGIAVEPDSLEDSSV